MREVKNHIETNCVQAGYTPGSGEPRQIPIIQSTTFKYDTCEAMGQLFDLEAEGYFYSRLQNPTCDHVAAKICDMEGGSAAMVLARNSGSDYNDESIDFFHDKNELKMVNRCKYIQ